MLFSGTAAATSMALISGIGSSGGFFGPSLIGVVKRATGGEGGAFLTLAGIGIVGCFVCLGLRRTAQFKRGPLLAAGPPAAETR
jgi:ACS family tartrate transporter-like MFS transporter